MRKPRNLKFGDKIAIVSTARKIELKDLSFSIQLLESWGLKIVLGKSINAEDFQFAGSDELRAKDFQTMLDDDSIKAILCARGGYGTIRILDLIDFSRFMLKPKWIIGYSDVTILHAHINNYLAVETIHASMPVNFKNNTKSALNSLNKVLFDEKITYDFEAHKMNRLGKTEGEIIGGNLSILYSILGTKSGFNSDNKILFIEDIDEMLYHIDRMVIALKRASKLNKIKALLVGAMTDMRDNTKAFNFQKDNTFGKSAKEIILEHTKEFNYPIAFDIPVGHIKNNNTLVFGRKVKLDINDKNVTLSF